MDSWKCLCFIVTLFCILKAVDPLELQFSNVVGNVGSNDTTLRCAFTKTGGEKVQSVILLARNVSMDVFSQIAGFLPDQEGILLPDGQYLSERVIISNLTQRSSDVSLRFKDLQCDLETSYRCKVVFFSFSEGQQDKEKEMNLTVSVTPSIPNIIWDGFSISEGANVSFFCHGMIGNPPGTFSWQRWQGGHQYMNGAVSTKLTLADESCYYRGTSNLTIQVTDSDNNAVIRCSVNNSYSDVYFTETQPLSVLYKIRKPTIAIQPDNQEHLENSSIINMTCTGNGNPEPSYTWYKKGNVDEVLSSSNTLSITEVITKRSGVYICNASNNISEIKYTESMSVNISIVTVLRTTTPVPTTTTTPKEGKKNTSKDKFDIIIVYVVVGVVAVLIIVVVVGCVVYRWKRLNVKEDVTITVYTARDIDGYDSVDIDKGNGVHDNQVESDSRNLGYIQPAGKNVTKEDKTLNVKEDLTIAVCTARDIDGYDYVDIDKGNDVRDKQVEPDSRDNLGCIPSNIEQQGGENVNKEDETPAPDEYASVNEATKIENRTFDSKPPENQRNTNQDDVEDPYIDSKDAYAQLGQKLRHKSDKDLEIYDEADSGTNQL